MEAIDLELDKTQPNLPFLNSEVIRGGDSHFSTFSVLVYKMSVNVFAAQS